MLSQGLAAGSLGASVRLLRPRGEGGRGPGLPAASPPSAPRGCSSRLLSESPASGADALSHRVRGCHLRGRA